MTLVPRRADGGHRDRLWEFCRAWWVNDFPDWAVIEGHHESGPFNRSAALNQAARQQQWDMAVVIDADIIANPEAVRSAVAAATDQMVVSHRDRIMLNRHGTEKILAGYRGPWRTKQMVETVYTDSVSCAVAIPRALWEAVGGFDEQFVGWGHEDSAFAIAAETITGKPIVRLDSELFHLWHSVSPEFNGPTRKANVARLQRYRQAAGDSAAIAALRLPPTRIPRILHRTVPAETSDQVEVWWSQAQALHPGWEFRTHRDPLDAHDWPLTGDLWDRCQNGAQKAGLIRLEALVTHGGVYYDSDVEPVRSLEPLLQLRAFAGWEDETTCPDAVLGAEPNHPAFVMALDKARRVIEGGGDAYQSGPAVTTELLPNRDDVLILPPGAFYDAHYLQKAKLKDPHPPYAFARHHWHGSWLSDAQRRSIEQRQRA